MSLKGNIKKILFVALWCMAGAGLMVLLVAAINKRNGQTCKGYEVRINNGKGQLFVTQAQVVDLLTFNGKQKLAGKTVASFDLRRMEELLKKNIWIREAQLFFDNNELLKIRVTEREPVARIFTAGGNSFYMDSMGVELPLSDESIVRLPVFTNFPSEKLSTRGADSLLVKHIGVVADCIRRDSFWMAQVGQIDISPSRTFEMIPVVGNHLIEFGDGEDCQQKLDRLLIFYKEVLAKTGFEKYDKVDVRFSGQVVGTRKGNAVSRADSLLAIKNIGQLIKAAQQMQFDTAHAVDVIRDVKTEVAYVPDEEPRVEHVDSLKRTDVKPRSASSQSAAAPGTAKTPKAIMKKKDKKQ